MQTYTVASGRAVVTGAAGGIGEALARALAARGSDLALLDRDGARLEAVAASLRAQHPSLRCDTRVVDLADLAATTSAAAWVLEQDPRVTLLINNAGVALGGRFDQVTLEEFFWVMDVNFRATVAMTHALLGALTAVRGSHLVNVSSLFGLIAPPGQSAYASSKFAVRGFTEALRGELAPRGVGVTCVHPGGIRTRIAVDSRIGSGVPAEQAGAGAAAFDALLRIPASVAAETIVRGVERRRPRVLIGASAKIPDVAARVLPAQYTPALAMLERVGRRLGSRR